MTVDNYTFLFLILFLTPLYWSIKSLSNNESFWKRGPIVKAILSVTLIILLIISRLSLLLYIQAFQFASVQVEASKYIGLFIFDSFYWIVMSSFLNRKYANGSIPIFNEIIINAVEILLLPLLELIILLTDFVFTFDFKISINWIFNLFK